MKVKFDNCNRFVACIIKSNTINSPCIYVSLFTFNQLVHKEAWRHGQVRDYRAILECQNM